jgi:DNA sulfur modification protein DndC
VERADLVHMPEPHDRDARLLGRLDESRSALMQAIERGFDHWIVTFSGGKDSTAMAVLSLEAGLELGSQVRRIDIVYADTLLEIPSIQRFASFFLESIASDNRLVDLPLFTHTVKPAAESSFWVLLLGRGYPPPHQRFRWCTRRLKIEPAEMALKQYTLPGRTSILTGVRFGESKARDARLATACSRGGECGQGVWLQHSQRLQATYMAPIVDWEECDVWDYLTLVAPTLGYKTEHLEDVYNGHDTRFGCWVCTVVSQEKALTRTVEKPEWEHLRPLLEFRAHLWRSTRDPATRLEVDGRPGRLNLMTRQRVLSELLEVQRQVGTELVSDPELRMIRELWKEEFGMRTDGDGPNPAFGG